MTDRLSKLEAAKIAHSDAVRAAVEKEAVYIDTYIGSPEEREANREWAEAKDVADEALAAVLALLQEPEGV